MDGDGHYFCEYPAMKLLSTYLLVKALKKSRRRGIRNDATRPGPFLWPGERGPGEVLPLDSNRRLKETHKTLPQRVEPLLAVDGKGADYVYIVVLPFVQEVEAR